ncbi:hypothetical protein C2S51_037113 [Perilla frutescens var. frutescens]|nr:hypothetical protein C2S51_037113 [Perilla frutescens var. frutescens]
MASYFKNIIYVALILTVAIPISTSHREKWRRSDEPKTDTKGYLRDLCSKTNKSNECWKILKPELYRFSDSSDKNIASIVMDMAKAKSNEVHDKLNHYYSDSKNDELKDKYTSCSKNYNDINRNLIVTERDLDSDNYANIPVQINDASEELKNCMQEFEKDSFDPAHIRDRNKELGLYLEIVWLTMDRMKNEHDNDRD